MSLMGLDIGTTGCKAIVFNLEGEIISQAYREYPLYHPQPGYIELDPHQVWQMVKEAIGEVASHSGKDPIKAFSLSVLGEAAVPLDGKGNILGRSIIGFDVRGKDIIDEMAEKIGKEKLMKITGQPASPIHTLIKLIWMKRNRPEVFRRMDKFLCFEDFAFYKMGLPPTIDYSLAARTMAFDINAKDWSKEMLGFDGLDESLLAEVKSSGTIVGEVPDGVAEELGLPSGVKAIVGGHDQPMGALGAGIIEKNIAMDATGTVECICPAFDKPVLNRQMVEHAHCCYPHVVEGLYVTLVYNFTGGSLLRWYRDTLGGQEREKSKGMGKDVYDVIIGEAEKEPSKLFVLPHFTMTGTPYFDSRSRGAVLGLTLSTGKGEIIKAILEGITFEMKLNLEYLKEAGVEVSELRAIGGGAKSEEWLQLKADMFGKPVVSLNVSEAACLGGAILSGVATGEYASLREAVSRVVRKKEVYHPDKDKQRVYEEKFEIYEKIYPTLREINHQMS